VIVGANIDGFMLPEDTVQLNFKSPFFIVSKLPVIGRIQPHCCYWPFACCVTVEN